MLLTLCMILFGIVCVLLVFIIVIQPSHSEGLAGAFGGSGSDSFFGTRAGQHMNRFTIGLAVIFLLLAIAIGFLQGEPTAKQPGGDSIMSKTPAEQPAPTPAPEEKKPQ